MVHKNGNSGILITGASRGIGLMLAEAFLARGDTVFGFSRSAAALDHENYCHYSLDIADEREVGSAMRDIAAKGGIDVLINNAALKKDGLSMLTPVANFEEMTRTNQQGTFIVTKHAAMMMKKKRFGRVINFSSVAVPLTTMGTIVYGATKAAAEQMSKVFAREFASEDITFNTIGISSVEGTDMFSGINEREMTEMEKHLLKPGALSKDELLAAIDFFVLPQASKITGQTLYFGGLAR